MQVVENLQSRPLYQRCKNIQEVREVKMPNALPGFTGCKLPNGSVAEGKQEGNDEEDEVQRVEK